MHYARGTLRVSRAFWYDSLMRIYLVVFLTLLLATPALAFQLLVTTTERPYEIVPLPKAPAEQVVALGELNSFPIMYEVVSGSQFQMVAQVEQPYTRGGKPLDFALLVVRQDDRGGGVTEVARLHAENITWQVQKDHEVGMTFWQSKEIKQMVGPGTYRIEVSTPDNVGKYRLWVGAADDGAGYFETLGHIRTTQRFFGYSVVHMLSSSRVYYPLGIVLLLLIIHRTWKLRNKIVHA